MNQKRVPKKVLVTGSAGLIGSEAVRFFCGVGSEVVGIDNDMRQYFFGKEASTAANRKKLEASYSNYAHHKIDIRDQKAIEKLFQEHKFDLIVHTAAQPSHDWAAKEPLTDFSINAVATHGLLECLRKYAPEAVFVFLSTNKVYGDNPNRLPVKELQTRWELPKTHPFYNGIDETMSIDNCTHSIFGVSKAAADLMVQEYGRYFGLKTVCFRGGCLTGASHAGAILHGFLAYLVKCVAEERVYNIFGYKGKQVRDNIHASDVINAIWHVYQNPRSGEAYNMGGSRVSNVSLLEAVKKAESCLGKKAKLKYDKTPRIGDHIWYVSNLKKFQNHYPEWKIAYGIDAIIEDIAQKSLAKKK